MCLIPFSVMFQLVGYTEKPVNLQMFIGTADDRYLRPHAFYQVHRITGKTVATASQEIVITSTKVLEIPLLPENNMSAWYMSRIFPGCIFHLRASRSEEGPTVFTGFKAYPNVNFYVFLI